MTNENANRFHELGAAEERHQLVMKPAVFSQGVAEGKAQLKTHLPLLENLYT